MFAWRIFSHCRLPPSSLTLKPHPFPHSWARCTHPTTLLTVGVTETMAPAARCGLWLACAAAMAALAVAQTPPPPPPPRHNPSIMLPDEADGGGEYLSLLLSSQAHALASLAPPSTDPLASSLAGLAQVLLTLHDSVQADTNKPFHAPPLAALFAAGKHQVNTTAADAALSIADRVLDELAAADWTQPVLSKRVTHALGLEELFAADKAEWFAPAPAPPPVQPWPSKGQAVVDELNSSPAAAEKNAAADDHIQATQADYEQALTDARWRGKEMQSQRVIVDGISGVGPRLRQLEDGKLPRLQPLPNKTLKGNPLPPPKKQVVDVFKPGANATLVESERHLNLTKARFPIAPNNSDLIGPVIDILTADPVGSALAPALASPVGRDPKLFNPITSYTTTSTFGVGQSVRKYVGFDGGLCGWLLATAVCLVYLTRHPPLPPPQAHQQPAIPGPRHFESVSHGGHF